MKPLQKKVPAAFSEALQKDAALPAAFTNQPPRLPLPSPYSPGPHPLITLILRRLLGRDTPVPLNLFFGGV